jgi:hypothetical protein
MNFRWLGPVVLLAALFVGDQIRINRPGHKYRLTVEVETPEGLKTGSGVVSVHPDRVTAVTATPAPRVTRSLLISAAAKILLP